MQNLGIILVHYHSPALLAPAIAALRRDAAGLVVKPAIDIVVVDNGSSASEKETLAELVRSAGVRICDPGSNLGYAAGLNAGARLLPSADALVLMNPDVLVEPGCLAALIAQLGAGAAAVGPAFFWDESGGFELPPTEAASFTEDLLRVLAARYPGAWASLARSRWRGHASRHFAATSAIPSYDLSGAMLLVDAKAFRGIGCFDEGYALYFEETDFMQRLRRAGMAARFEPRARAVHLYAQSTPRDGRAGELFAASQRRFRETFYGAFGAGCLAALSRGASSSALPKSAVTLAPEGPWRFSGEASWLELSPSPLGFPAAARRLPPGTSAIERIVGPGLLARMAPGPWWLRSVSPGGHELDFGKIVVAEDQIKSLSPRV